MSFMTPTAPSYVRLINMLRAVREMSPFCELTADEGRLLDELLVRWHSASEIKVSDLMRASENVSQTTTYRRLISLRGKGLIELRVDESDKRVKFVMPTSAASEYQKLMSQNIDLLIVDRKRG